MKYCLIFLTLFTLSQTISSQVLATCVGGDASSLGGSISYTAGQIAYSTLKISDITFSEGIQHPYKSSEIINPSDTTNQEKLIMACTVFPNPTANNVSINIKGSNLKNLAYYLYDSNRKLIKEEIIQANSTVVNMVDLPTGLYFLTVKGKSKNILRIFKIIKDQIQ